MLGTSYKLYTWYDCHANDINSMNQELEIAFNINLSLISFLDENGVKSPYYSIPNELIDFTKKYQKIIIVMENNEDFITIQNGHHNMFVDNMIALEFYKFDIKNPQLLVCYY